MKDFKREKAITGDLMDKKHWKTEAQQRHCPMWWWSLGPQIHWMLIEDQLILLRFFRSGQRETVVHSFYQLTVDSTETICQTIANSQENSSKCKKGKKGASKSWLEACFILFYALCESLIKCVLDCSARSTTSSHWRWFNVTDGLRKEE